MSTSVKYLGVHVDAKLTWKDHIAYVCNKISRAIGVMYKIRNHITKEALLLIYRSLVHSYILYCIETWGCAYKTALEPIYILQKKAVRIICNAGYREHSAPLFRQLKIRNVFEEIKYRRQLLAFDVVKNPNRYEFDLKMDHSHEYPTRFSRNNIPLEKFKSERFGLKGIRSEIIQAYNSLPFQVKMLHGSRLTYAKRLLNATNQSILES